MDTRNIHFPSFHLDHTEAEFTLILICNRDKLKKKLALFDFNSSSILNIVIDVIREIWWPLTCV